MAKPHYTSHITHYTKGVGGYEGWLRVEDTSVV